jgi:hypothetical protein
VTTLTSTRISSRTKPPGRRPDSAFTETQPGETLADVAVRIYGTPDATRALWHANRDQVADPNAALAEATVLRTP